MKDDFKTPGQLIAALLEQRSWSQRVLAVVLEKNETGINKIVADNRRVSADLAIALEEVFDVPAKRFLDLQRDFDLAKARLVARPNAARSQRAQLFGGLPVPAMIKRGWLDADDVRDVSRVESALTRFFGVTSITEIEVLPHAAKKTAVAEGTTPQQLAWLYRVRQITREMIVAEYSPLRVKRAIGLLKKLVFSVEEARKVPRILAEAGIRFTIVESLPQAKIDGVCFWLDNTSPVIGMSLRYDRIDNFWFVLRHELEHVLQCHGQDHIAIDSDLSGSNAGTGLDVAAEERVANAAAAEFCVPRKTMDAFIARKSPFFAERDILALSAMLRVHPGIIAGQLQNRTGRYDRFRRHLVKIRSVVSPGAAVDGWGDIAPVIS